MKDVNALTTEQLKVIVSQLRDILYLDQDANGREFWNDAKSWSPDTLDAIAEVVAEHGLTPTEVDSVMAL